MTDKIDRIAMGLSGLCLVHCLGTAVLLGVLSTSAGWLGSPVIHEVGLMIAATLGAIALLNGVLRHRQWVPAAIGAAALVVMGLAIATQEGARETVLTVTGVSVLALAHFLNRRALA